jgi:prepilin-type processing-associated H-X9-DG protein
MQLYFRVLGGAVVLVLVWGLVGLVVVAVTRVREAGARSQCQYHLKQIGLTFWNFEGSNGHFPTATMPNDKLPPEKRLSWLVSIVPYIEANNLYSRFDKEKSWDAEENRYLCFTPYMMYQCPAFPPRPPVSTMVSSHYLGITGQGANAAELPLNSPRAGFFGYDRQLTDADLGNHANTLVALESLQIQGSWTAGGPPTVRGLDTEAAPYFGTDSQFGGIHREGVNALFADASVRFLPQSLDPAVIAAVATIKGSKTGNLPAGP